jgi:hypothetical protein
MKHALSNDLTTRNGCGGQKCGLVADRREGGGGGECAFGRPKHLWAGGFRLRVETRRGWCAKNRVDKGDAGAPFVPRGLLIAHPC